jgi:hypothetical protein
MSDLAQYPIQEEESVLKPRVRKSPNFTPEQRQAMSERMKKVNAERIAKARARPENATREQMLKEAEENRLAKQKELEAEIERLKAEAALAPKLAKIPKTRKPKLPKDDSAEMVDALIQKARERNRAPSPVESESESEEEVPPPPKTRRTKKTIPELQAPKVVAKFL